MQVLLKGPQPKLGQLLYIEELHVSDGLRSPDHVSRMNLGSVSLQSSVS